MSHHIFVPLLNEGLDVWRPVAAEHVGGDAYRIVEETPEGEEWQFKTGTVVRCRMQNLSGDFGSNQNVLTAFELNESPNAPGKS